MIEDYGDVAVDVTVGQRDPVRITNYSPNAEGCVELFYTPPHWDTLFLFFLKGLPVKVNLFRTAFGSHVFDEPVECAFGSMSD